MVEGESEGRQGGREHNEYMVGEGRMIGRCYEKLVSRQISTSADVATTSDFC